MKFVDYVTVTVRSGSGGAGAVAFRREKFVPRGGPSGGDGGDGGSVYVEADANLYTLLDLRYNRHHFAENGRPGEGSNKHGKSGEDIVLLVPPGTVVRETGSGALIGEVVEPGDRLMLARGGRGGKGNTFFKSATRRSPDYAQPGEEGEERDVTLELKLLADVGLVGFPNAGKSTLVAAVSAARPKIAGYPFTTLEPNLGMVRCGSYQSFVMADIPGIIEGAHEGRGLGLRFLKHIERNAVLLFLIPVHEEDPVEKFETLRAELEAYNPELLGKPFVVALSMADLLTPEERRALEADRGGFPADVEVHVISAVARIGIERLKSSLLAHVEMQRADAPGTTSSPT